MKYVPYNINFLFLSLNPHFCSSLTLIFRHKLLDPLMCVAQKFAIISKTYVLDDYIVLAKILDLAVGR